MIDGARAGELWVGEAEEAGGTGNRIGEDEIAAVGRDGAGDGQPVAGGEVGFGIQVVGAGGERPA